MLRPPQGLPVQPLGDTNCLPPQRPSGTQTANNKLVSKGLTAPAGSLAKGDRSSHKRTWPAQLSPTASSFQSRGNSCLRVGATSPSIFTKQLMKKRLSTGDSRGNEEEWAGQACCHTPTQTQGRACQLPCASRQLTSVGVPSLHAHSPGPKHANCQVDSSSALTVC